MYLDHLCLIITKSGDGGDTAQNEGFVSITEVGKLSAYRSIIQKLEPKNDGLWVRHPEQYPDTSDFSRDQATPNIIAMGLFGFRAPLKRMAKAQVKRYGLYQNGDLLMPDNAGQFLRAFNWKIFYPFLWFSDLFILINTLIICFIKAREPGPFQQWLGRNIHWIFVQGEPDGADGTPGDAYGEDNVGTDKNHIASLYQAQRVMPTLVSWFARKLYKWLRPLGPQYALNHYYRVDNPEIAEAWKQILENF